METYDPLRSPTPHEWLALSELERIEMVEAFHDRSGGFGENLRLHSALHAIVENQLALQQPVEVCDALSRLMRQGLDRHEAVHAIGSVLAQSVFPILKAAENPPHFDEPGYREALHRLTARSWRRG